MRMITTYNSIVENDEIKAMLSNNRNKVSKIVQPITGFGEIVVGRNPAHAITAPKKIIKGAEIHHAKYAATVAVAI